MKAGETRKRTRYRQEGAREKQRRKSAKTEKERKGKGKRKGKGREKKRFEKEGNRSCVLLRYIPQRKKGKVGMPNIGYMVMYMSMHTAAYWIAGSCTEQHQQEYIYIYVYVWILL